MDDLRYPIGRHHFPAGSTVADTDRRQWIDQIAAAPAELEAAIAGLSALQLDTPYRPGGWTVRQVVHHLPDSHVNAYIRTKLALTEDRPTIKPYEEARWAELPDGKSGPIAPSLALLHALHERWVSLLRQLGPTDLAREFFHPEHQRTMSLDEVLSVYAWHGRHHIAHITSLRQRMRWT